MDRLSVLANVRRQTTLTPKGLISKGEILREIPDCSECHADRRRAWNVCPSRATRHENDHSGALLDHRARRGAGGDNARRFAPEQMIARLHHTFIFITGRTSTAPSTSRIGQPLESSTACARSRASMSVYPPTMSFVSGNGPSVTVFCLPFTSLPVRSSGCPWSLT